MGFRKLIENRWLRRRWEQQWFEDTHVTPPSNPTPRYIRRLLRQLLDDRRARRAARELELIGTTAVPQLIEAARDTRNQPREREEFSTTPAPLDTILRLLTPHAPDVVHDICDQLLRTGPSRTQELAALHFGSLGTLSSLPRLLELLRGDENLANKAFIGVRRAIDAGRVNIEMRTRLYDSMLEACERFWSASLQHPAELAILLDRARAAGEFPSVRWIRGANPNACKIVRACTAARIKVPEHLLRPLLADVLARWETRTEPMATGDIGAALEALAESVGEAARPELEHGLKCADPWIREGAARGLTRLAGLEEPLDFVLLKAGNEGYEQLTHEQRVVYCAYVFDLEVCNGGIMQFFYNRGERVRDTLSALRELNHAVSIRALESAVAAVGPLAYDPDMDRRLSAFEGRYDELFARFSTLEKDYYEVYGELVAVAMMYAVKHASHFRE